VSDFPTRLIAASQLEKAANELDSLARMCAVSVSRTADKTEATQTERRESFCSLSYNILV
jgi:hypothetical protein